MTDGVIVGGQSTGSGQQATQSYGDQRRCAEPRCGRPLSRYNPSEMCHDHPTSVVRPLNPSKSAYNSLMEMLNA